MYMGARPRPDSSEAPECLAQAYCCELTAEPTISIVDNVQHEDDEDEYEEMEEEDGDNDAIPFHEVTHFADRREVESADQCEPFTTTPPHCLVCGRTRTPKTRLFKWPDDASLRRSWLAFFHLELDALEHCKVPYICNIHFDANQFLYEGNRIFWKRDPYPRYRQRRSVLAEPFPWELEQNFEKKLFQQPSENFRCPRLKHGAIHDHLVTFRESYYKSKTKSSHPVAVVSLPENPNVFYEFSYTRTSSIDSSKFYSCLTSRVKDVIRTIHIKDGAIQSRGDPFWGHHFACRPFTSLVLP
ncbi:unnamed protein product [Heligmosomoides polygyrus]|uniref:THAP-type domain-containing protein n=1 Tax=Heligmosomoides polygyrus TaxID=6339 RepID=A0A183G4J5_HELPZ|nr:unnamed protein product [Heligmosomoides polygyrus]